MTTPTEQPPSLAALIAALRETAEALEQGATWAEIGAALQPPRSGRQAKRHAHKLREQVKRELQALSARFPAPR